MNLRKPNPSYQGKNGFSDHITAPVDKEHPDDVALRHVRMAQYMLANKGTYAPSPDTLRKKLGQTKSTPPDTVESINDKIRQLKEQHNKDLENLFRFQRAEYQQELKDHHMCHDESAYMDVDEAYPDQVAFKKALEELDTEVGKMDRLKRDVDDGLSMVRYTYLRTLMQYVQRREKLKTQDEHARRRRDAWFPQTMSQYHQITERDVQLRVARFLMASTAVQEKMMDEYGWAYRAVHPLLQAYKNNDAFKSEIDGSQKGLFVRDPRFRPSVLERAAPSVRDEQQVFKRFSPVS